MQDSTILWEGEATVLVAGNLPVIGRAQVGPACQGLLIGSEPNQPSAESAA